MDTTTVDSNNNNNVVADDLSVQTSVTYTDPGGIVQSYSGSQSVHTTVTHGTQGTVQTNNTPTNNNNNTNNSHPSSPNRPGTTSNTPLSMSPSSTSTRHSQPQSQSQSQQVHPDVFRGMKSMPQYSTSQPQQQQQQQQLPTYSGVRPRPQHQHHHQQQQQQQALHNTYPTNRERSNPVSDDDNTEPSSSGNTGPENGQTGYTRSDSASGATSTFGKLIQNATKVRSLKIYSKNLDAMHSDYVLVLSYLILYSHTSSTNSYYYYYYYYYYCYVIPKTHRV
jgi:hypothetical protein